MQDHPHLDTILAAWRDGGWEPGTILPFHSPHCYGCGPDNPAGFLIEAVVPDEPDAVQADVVLDDRFVGAPGVAHGGAIAAVFDDVFGHLLLRLLVTAVTRDLHVRYRRRVLLHRPARLTARLDRRDGREVHVSATLEQEGELRATSTGVFVVVTPEQLFASDGAAPQSEAT